jgi:putative membrane protein
MLNMLALVVSLDQLLPVLVTAIVFVVLGLLIFAVAFLVIIYVSPFSVKKEIEEDQNTSLGIIIGSVILGIAIIIAAAIHG